MFHGCSGPEMNDGNRFIDSLLRLRQVDFDLNRGFDFSHMNYFYSLWDYFENIRIYRIFDRKAIYSIYKHQKLSLF